MFDVFYINQPTGLFGHERRATCIDQARSSSRTRYLWIVDGLNDYSGFDWLWEPSPWQAHQAHVWPSQHQENGGTWLVPRDGFEQVNREHAVIQRRTSVPRLHIQHCSNTQAQGDVCTRFISDYLGTLKRALARVDWTYCWVTADVCDYDNFDWTWHPSEWQADMLHVFASDEQRFGDTFYIHVPSFMQKVQDLALLEWYETLNFVESPAVPRRPVPVCQHQHGSQVPAVWQYDFQDPVVQFSNHDVVDPVPATNLWREKTRTIVPLTSGASAVLVPRDAKNHMRSQLYDYPHIDKSHRHLGTDHPLDVVFISNGEATAERNYQHLSWHVQRSNHNRVTRVDGVNGRVAAYHAAARSSTTDWFFAVFAKLEIDYGWDWNWQPDRMQEAKHYIFHARNAVTNLTYGHQAMIAYNRELVLQNLGHGLDFTLDQPHEVVPILSGLACYTDTPWMAWRTAFREVLKLKHSPPDVENQYRLHHWLNYGTGLNGEWSVQGAQDAVEYYDSVNGDPVQLHKSYEWSWLASYALVRRNLVADR